MASEKERKAIIERQTNETEIRIVLNADGRGDNTISTGIPFFDHMLTLFAVHGFFDLTIKARGDLDVDYHHTVEDLGLVLGKAFDTAMGDRNGIIRYGHAVTPMDETLTMVTADLSKRPFLIYNTPGDLSAAGNGFTGLTKEFFRAFVNQGGLNLHINVLYGENEHHIIESIFKACGRALDQALMPDNRIIGVRSSKGVL
jgi:imidazoleglycerol-phosphate dehydratase